VETIMTPDGKERSMKLDKLNQWLTLAANIGVLAGIVFLAVEIRQNDATLRESNTINILDARALELQQYNEFRALLVQTPDLLELWTAGLNGDVLDDLADEIYLTLCTSWLWLSVTAYERSLALDRLDTAEQTVRLRGETLRDRPGFRRCWESNRALIIGYGVQSYVDPGRGIREPVRADRTSGPGVVCSSERLSVGNAPPDG
jgi:hypothetical protein